MKDRVILQQTLHGYEHGHRLIAASISLRDETAYMMQNMSDLSGSATSAAFDGYLTGYWLPERRGYAIARTWFAYEMPRPGSVWTHSLIISQPDLRRVGRLKELLELLSRPKSTNDIHRYTVPVEIEENYYEEPYPHQLSNHGGYELARTLETVFAGKWQPALIIANDGRELEQIPIAIWDQLWPRLRQRLSFCTGSFGLRSIAGRLLDIQIVPREHKRIAQYAGVRHVIDRIEDVISPKRWAAIAADNVRSYDIGMHDFLWRYGQDTQSTYSTYANLARLYLAAESGEELEEISSFGAFIRRAFPNSRDAKKLKSDMYSSGHLTGTRREWSDRSRLQFIAGAPVDNIADNFGDIDVSVMARNIAAEDLSEAKGLLSDVLKMSNSSRARDEVIAAIASVLPDAEVMSALDDHPSMVGVLARGKPELIYTTSFWNRLRVADSHWLSKLAAVDDIDYERLLVALAYSNQPHNIDGLLSGDPSAVCRAFVNVASSGALLERHVQWWAQNCSRFPTELCVALINPKLAPLEVITSSVAALQSRMLEESADGIVLLATRLAEESSSSYKGVLVPISHTALSYPYPWALDTLEITFEIAHDELATVNEPAAIGLSFLLPWYWLSDKPEFELSKALVVRFVASSWPARRLLSVARGDSIFREVIKAAGRVNGGFVLISELKELLRDNPESFTPGQASCLEA